MISKLRRLYLLTRNVKMMCSLVPSLIFFNERLGLNERPLPPPAPPLEWGPLLKDRKLNERPAAHSDSYGIF